MPRLVAQREPSKTRVKARVRLLQFVFKRYMRWRISEVAEPEYAVLLRFPIDPTPRYGDGKPPHPKLAALIAQQDESYLRLLEKI